MKRLSILMLTLILCLVAGLALADEKCGPNLTWTLSDAGVLTIQGTGPMDSYSYGSGIPWKDQRDNIKSVVIEEGVTSIGEYAFYWCRNLTTVSLPESVASIGQYAFENCSKLVSLNIPTGVTVIPKWCFYGCKALNSLTLPEGLTTIEELAFADCESILELTIPASVVSISDDRVFKGCDRLAGINVAVGNPSYISVDGVLYNADQTILMCYPAGKAIPSFTVPQSVTSIAAYAFYWNENITSITIPNTVTTIGNDAFAGCSKMTSINFAEGLVSIGNTAFHQCRSLTTIVFPASLISLGDDMFESCSKLTRIEVAEGSTAFTSVDGVLFSDDMTTLVAFPPAATKNAYVIPEGVTTIGEYAFLYNKNLVSITFPSTLITIGSSAFSGCDKITTIDLPEGLVSLDYHAFSSCDSLTIVTIPYSCLSLGDGVFDWDEHLTTVNIKNPYTSFDRWGVFGFCGDALTVYAPAGSTAEAHCTEENIKFVVKAFDVPAPTQEPNTNAQGNDTWTCPECGTEMNRGKFCFECGTPRPQGQACTNCGYEVPEGMTMKFCPECGTKLE